MADCSAADKQIFNFQSQSPPGWGGKYVTEGDYGLFQDAVPLDDTVALDSILEDTQVIEDPDCIEDVRNQLITEHEEEVVLDSEDEVNCNAEFSGGAIGLSGGKADRRVQGNEVGLQKRPLCSPFPQLNGFAEAYDCSLAGEQSGTGKTPSKMHASDRVSAGVNYIGSEEAKDLSEANAIDFVNNYLSLNNVGNSPGTKSRDAVKNEVTPASRIKGCQTLAKQIKRKTPSGKGGPFEWDDNDHCGGAVFFGKRIGANFGLGGFLQRPIIRHQKARHVDSKEGVSSASKLGKKSINFHNEVTGSTSSDSRNVDFTKEMSGIEQVSKVSVELGQELDACNIEENAPPDMFDVGFSTQMAAEAMEALSNGLPGDVCQFPQNFLVDSSTIVSKSKSYFGKSCPQESAFSNLKGTGKMSKSSATTGTSSSYLKHSSHHELDNESEKTTRKLRGSLAGRSKRRRTSSQNEYSNRQSLKPVNRMEKEAECKNHSKECEDHGSSSITFEIMSLRKQFTQKKFNIHQNGHWMTGGKLESSRDGSDNVGGTGNNIGKGSIITYKRKRSSLVPKPNRMLSAGGQCTKLYCNNFNSIQEELFAHQTGYWMAGGEMEGTKDRPANSKEKVNDIMKGSIITYQRKRSPLGAKLSEVLTAGGKNSKLCCDTSVVTRDNGPTQEMQDSLEVYSLTGSLKFNAWNYPKGKRTLRKRRRHSDGAYNQNTPFIIFDEKDGYKKTYNKILPKSSLLKELIRLGIPEQKLDFKWKDTRKRRDMACIQVLFSQHLDDDIIKQQKKILARLGISIASCSMDATHFIADKFVRTRNMLETIALGKPVVTHIWLESCVQASCLIDEKNYILRDAKKEKEIGFSMPVSLARASQHPLLNGRRVLITPNIKPDKEMITSLVKAVHGQAMERNQISELKIPDDLLILSCEEDQAICVPFLDKGAAAYSSELLLNGIVTQRLDYQRHQLFTNYAKRNLQDSKR